MYRPEQGIRLRSCARTDRGRVRQNNEDNIHLWGGDNYILAAVADGMGGAAAGEEASRIAVETIQSEMCNDLYKHASDYRDMPEEMLLALLEDVIQRANANIYERALEVPKFKGMGTTLTMAFARKARVVIGHVGDSRAYIVEGQSRRIQQITSDHSFVQALVDAGHISPAEAEEHPMRNVLYRALGQSSEIDIDLIQDVHLQINDRLVICSDGLTLHVSEEEIRRIASASYDPESIVDSLILLANQRGGRDNISVIVLIADEDIMSQGTESLNASSKMPREGDDPTRPGVQPARKRGPGHTMQNGRGNPLDKPKS